MDSWPIALPRYWSKWGNSGISQNCSLLLRLRPSNEARLYNSKLIRFRGIGTNFITICCRSILFSHTQCSLYWKNIQNSECHPPPNYWDNQSKPETFWCELLNNQNPSLTGGLKPNTLRVNVVAVGIGIRGSVDDVTCFSFSISDKSRVTSPKIHLWAGLCLLALQFTVIFPLFMKPNWQTHCQYFSLPWLWGGFSSRFAKIEQLVFVSFYFASTNIVTGKWEEWRDRVGVRQDCLFFLSLLD